MKKDILKKIVACVCVLGLVLAGAACKKDKEQPQPTPTPEVEIVQDEGIENGGEIDDEGNIIEGSDEPLEVAQPDLETNEQPNGEADGFLGPQIQVELKYGDDGNITKECAIELLQKYTAEQLGLTPNVSHQLLFDANGATVDGKACYAIAAKIPGKDTEGVFYVALDGSSVYRYDLANQLYITMP